MAGAPTRTCEIVIPKGSLALKSCQFLSLGGVPITWPSAPKLQTNTWTISLSTNRGHVPVTINRILRILHC